MLKTTILTDVDCDANESIQGGKHLQLALRGATAILLLPPTADRTRIVKQATRCSLQAQPTLRPCDCDFLCRHRSS